MATMQGKMAIGVVVILALVLSLATSLTADPIEQGRYIVVLHEGANQPKVAARQIAEQVDGQVGFIYEHAVKGFSLTLPIHALSALARNPQVKYVATDDLRHVFIQDSPSGIKRIFASTNSSLGINGVDDYRVDVDVAVVDTGIDFEHPDLNVVGGVNCSGGSPFSGNCVPGGDDDHYHGTHVAGTIGAIDNGFGVVGVAPGARLWSVKVLKSNGSGYTSWIVAGLDWIAANADTIEVANMSLGGSGFNQAEYDAIQGCVNKGVAFAVAAGNSDDDASNYSPAAFDNVLTVSALADFDGLEGALSGSTCRADQDDTLADFSNWGSAVDIAAPGVCIYSTFPLEQGEYGTISGTSMASPHAAGALALLASDFKATTANDVSFLYNQIITSENFNWSDDSGDNIQETLLDVSDSTLYAPALVVSGGEVQTNNPPVVSITEPTDGASFVSGTSISFAATASDTEDGDLSGGLEWTSNQDGTLGSGGSFSISLTDGTHYITASTTDPGGLEGSDSVTVTVGGGADFILTVDAYKVKGTQYADLSWNNTTETYMDVYRDGSVVETLYNVGGYTDIGGKGGGSAVYQVCEAQTQICSNESLVTW